MLLCLLLDHGFRCGEIAGLTLQCVNLNEETLTFYREKVDLVQTQTLTKETHVALRRYLECVLLASDSLLQADVEASCRDACQDEQSRNA